MWEYCTLSKLDLDENPGMLDDGDRMRIEHYKSLMDFYLRNKTLKVSDEEIIMEIFSYFVDRDMILLASLMQHTEQQEENTMLSGDEEEKQNEMETEIALLLIWVSTFFLKQKSFSKPIKDESHRMFG